MTPQEETVRRLLGELNEVGEHARIEAKTASELGKSALETICAFANEPDLGGGHLLLGVARAETQDLFDERPYTVVGVEDPEQVSDDLASKCASAFNRPIRPRVTPVPLDGKTVLHVQVDEARAEDKPIYLTRFGLPRGAFRRVSATDQRGTDGDLQALYALHRHAPYDRELAARATLDDIDPDAIRTYRKLLTEAERGTELLLFSDEELLEALGAAEKTEGGLKPTVAGILLFGTRLALRRDFAMMRVDYIRVPGTEWIEDASNRYEALIEIRAPLLTALLRAETAVLDDLPRKFHLPEGSLQRQDILPLPRKVLREAIVNALMHRDYRVHGPVQIIRFANRIEIHNPGYSLKPPDQLGEPGSATRNPTIASVYHDTDLAETKGTGIRTMRRLMEEAEMAPPMFESERAENRFTARIPLYHFLSKADLEWLEGIGEDLSAAERLVLVNVRDQGTTDNPSVRSMTGLDSLAASALLRRLCALDLLSKEGASTATYYVPTARFLNSLPEGIAVPGHAEEETPRASAGTSDVPERQSTMSEGLSTKTEGLSTKSDAQSTMLPEDLRNLVDNLGERAPDKTAMRHAIRSLCAWRPQTAEALAGILGRTANYLRTQYLRPMVAEGVLELTIPDKPRSRHQAYQTPDPS